MPLPKGRSPNYFNQPVAKAYNPTLRDKAAGLLSGLFGDTYQTNLFSRGLLGSSGLGGGAGPIAGMGLLDMTPLGAAFALEEAGRKIGRGDRVGGVADAALAVVPIPAAARGAKRVARRVAPKAAKRVAPAVPGPSIDGWHGTPYEFNKFDIAKVGTGEGAQVFGHGAYIADVPDTGRSYRDSVMNAKNMAHGMKVGGQPIESFYRQIAAQADRLPPSQAEAAYDRLSVIETLMHEGDVLGVREAAKAGQVSPAALDWFEKTVAPKFSRQGSLYQVRINADPNDFLDWDKPLSEQSPRVREALRPFGFSYDDAAADAHDKALLRALAGDGPEPPAMTQRNPTGGEIYESSKIVPGEFRDRVAASQTLQNAGVPGIKYLDQFSRNAGEGSRNFVVFDPRIIDIMKRYGVAAPVAAAILAGTMQPPKGREPGA